jgi:hypothetical protein
MSYIVQRNHRFYFVEYNGHDPISGSERRRWHPAGASHADAEAIRDRIDAARPATACAATDHYIVPRIGHLRLD